MTLSRLSTRLLYLTFKLWIPPPNSPMTASKLLTSLPNPVPLIVPPKSPMTSTEPSTSLSNPISLCPPSPTPQTSPYESLEPNLNISEVSLLIRTARKPGNKIALKQVKALFKNAEKTVRKKLAPTQIYIMDNWDSHSARSRRSSTFSLRSTADPPSRADHTVVCFIVIPPKDIRRCIDLWHRFHLQRPLAGMDLHPEPPEYSPRA